MSEDQEFFDRLEELIRNSSGDPSSTTAAEVLKQWGVPSVSIAILENGNITSRCISSIGDDQDTLFQACSISKPTAGLALMKLIEEGTLSLNDKICDRLPPHITSHLLSDLSTAPIVRTITLKQLMSHTSGMSQGGFPGYFDKANVPTASTIITGGPLVNTMPVKLISLPGLDFMYSGGGCTLIQLIMEHVTSLPFPTIMQKYVLDPLNMTRSFYILPSTETNLSKCYHNGTVPTEHPWHVLPEAAAAGLWTTPSDLLKLVRATQQSLEPDTAHPFMSRESATTMLTLVKQYMALTWFASDTQFGHSGGNAPAWRCYLYGYADLPWNKDRNGHVKEGGLLDGGPPGCGISVMTNSDVGLKGGTKILHAITWLKGWPGVDGFEGILGLTTPWQAKSGTFVDGMWKGWLGVKWSEEWELMEGEDGGPVVRLSGCERVVHRMVPAAMPGKKYEGGKRSVELMFEGLRMMMRFGWDGNERIVEILNDGREERTVLRSSDGPS